MIILNDKQLQELWDTVGEIVELSYNIRTGARYGRKAADELIDIKKKISNVLYSRQWVGTVEQLEQLIEREKAKING